MRAEMPGGRGERESVPLITLVRTLIVCVCVRAAVSLQGTDALFKCRNAKQLYCLLPRLSMMNGHVASLPPDVGLS